jgi:hypothetical protein
MDETLVVGSDTGGSVSEDYGPRHNRFTGTVNWVRIDVDAAAQDTDHLIRGGEALPPCDAKE